MYVLLGTGVEARTRKRVAKSTDGMRAMMEGKGGRKGYVDSASLHISIG